MNKRDDAGKGPSFPFALGILALTFSVIIIPSAILHIKIQPLFFVSWSVCVLALCLKGYSFDVLQAGMAEYGKKACVPVLFLFCSGAMTGVWNVCGTIPALTVAGVLMARAEWFLPAAFFVSLLFACLTGTVFGACGTIGVIFLAIGKTLGFSPELCIGVTTAGAFLGYGLSPAADCMNAASSLAGVEPGESVRCLWRVTLPVIVICAAFCGILNRNASGEYELISGAGELAGELKRAFLLGWPAFLPVLAVVILLCKKKPALLAMTAGSLTGIAVAAGYQRLSPEEILWAVWEGARFSGEGEAVRIFETGGIKSMADTAILFLLAFSLFGALESSGITQAVLEPLLAKADTGWKGDLIVVLSGFLTNIMSASAMCSFIFTVSCMAPVYEKKGFSRWNLLRASFVGCLYMSLWIPWHSNIVTPSALMGAERIQTGILRAVPALALLSFGFSLLLDGKKGKGPGAVREGSGQELLRKEKED